MQDKQPATEPEAEKGKDQQAETESGVDRASASALREVGNATEVEEGNDSSNNVQEIQPETEPEAEKGKDQQAETESGVDRASASALREVGNATEVEEGNDSSNNVQEIQPETEPEAEKGKDQQAETESGVDRASATGTAQVSLICQ